MLWSYLCSQYSLLIQFLQLRVGMSIGHSPEQSQYLPDMRKKEENVTNADRQEAKRRIEGSLAPDASVPNSSSIK